MSKASRRFNQVIKFTEDTANKMLDFLDESPVLFRSIQAILDIRADDPFKFDQHYLTLSDFHIFSYLVLRIKALFKKFFNDINFVYEDEDLYEIRDQYYNGQMDEEKIKKLKERLNYPVNKDLVKSFENDKMNGIDFSFCIQFTKLDNEDMAGMEILNNEINKRILNFLSIFPGKKEFYISSSTDYDVPCVLVNFTCQPDGMFFINEKLEQYKIPSEDRGDYIVWNLNDAFVSKVEFNKRTKICSMFVPKRLVRKIRKHLLDGNRSVISIRPFNDDETELYSNDGSKFSQLIMTISCLNRCYKYWLKDDNDEEKEEE